jgi:hypothetical protein
MHFDTKELLIGCNACSPYAEGARYGNDNDYWIGDWLDRRVILNFVQSKEISFLLSDLETFSCVRSKSQYFT